jgi:hypothetical protein
VGSNVIKLTHTNVIGAVAEIVKYCTKAYTNGNVDAKSQPVVSDVSVHVYKRSSGECNHLCQETSLVLP